MLSGRSDKKCPHDFSRGQSGFVEPQAVRTVAMTTSTNPIDSAIRFTAVFRKRPVDGSCFFGKMAGSGRCSRSKRLHHRCRCWVSQAKSRFSGLFVLPQIPLCRINQAKTISLIGRRDRSVLQQFRRTVGRLSARRTASRGQRQRRRLGGDRPGNLEDDRQACRVPDDHEFGVQRCRGDYCFAGLP